MLFNKDIPPPAGSRINHLTREKAMPDTSASGDLVEQSAIRIEWRQVSTGVTGHGSWFAETQRPLLEDWVERLNEMHGGTVVHTIARSLTNSQVKP